MKLHEIVEMARIVPFNHPEFDSDAVNATIGYLKTGQVIPIEGGKFNILKHERDYGLQRASDGEVIGWVVLEPRKTLGNRVVHPIANIQILPKFRNSGAAVILIHAVRQLAGAPICADGPILNGGQALIMALTKHSKVVSVYTFDKKTGDQRPYDPNDLPDDDSRAVLIERTRDELAIRLRYPVGQIKLVCSYFEELHRDLL